MSTDNTKPLEQRENITRLWDEITIQMDALSEVALTVNMQIEAAKLVNLLKPMQELEVEKTEDEYKLVLQLCITAMKSLTVAKPNMYLVRETRRELQDIVKKRRAFSRWFHSTQASLKVLCGLATALVAVSIFHSILKSSLSSIGQIDSKHLTLVVWYGAIGSIVSIMIRLDGLYANPEGSTSYFFLTGCFKPFLGVFFALFTYAVTMSQMIALDVPCEKLLFLIMVTSFLSGFSERFAKDVTDKAENAAFKS